jgi:hypothetical protein
MRTNLFISAAVAALLALPQVTSAGEIIDVAGTMGCVIDKWDESEPGKGRKLVDYAGRCIIIPDDAAVQKNAEDCVGKYEYMPDGSWKSSGTCTGAFKDGGKVFLTWEEGSHLEESVYTYTGGTGKYDGAKGGGTYKVDELTKTLLGGRKSGKLELR